MHEEFAQLKLKPMETIEGGTKCHLISESIRMMAKSVGITELHDEACKGLSEDLEYRLKEIVQNATKFSLHSKRHKLSCSDIDNALKMKNIEPLHGFGAAASDVIDLVSLIRMPLPKLPCDVSLRAHWLAVEGVQPAIPENVPPTPLKEQATPLTSCTSKDAGVKLTPLHLSLEQTVYYKEITDACIGFNDTKSQQALTSDTGIYQLLPMLINFIVEGVKVNLANKNLIMLHRLLLMVKSLCNNTTSPLEKYLHELLPPMVSCLLNRQICLRPEYENHWFVRDQAAKLLAVICEKYSNATNNIQGRLSRVYSQALDNRNHDLTVHYGAVTGLIEMGRGTVAALIVPRLKMLEEMIRNTNRTTVAEQIAASKLRYKLKLYSISIQAS